MSKPDSAPEDINKSFVIYYLALRRAVGILGIILPIILAIGLVLFSPCGNVQPSISDYFYTRMGSFFVGTMCAVALFLFSYKGYDKKDKIAGKLGCLFALGVAFFPTGPLPESTCSVVALHNPGFVNIIHFSSAGLLFLTLAYYSYFLFTKTSGEMTPQKRKRNRIYKVCGVIMVVCIILVFVYFEVPGMEKKFREFKPVFWLEAIALWAFGLSWLTKGEFILKD
jgi:uncharacterized membrane protein